MRVAVEKPDKRPNRRTMSTYNLQQNSVLRQKLKFILEEILFVVARGESGFHGFFRNVGSEIVLANDHARQ